MLQGSLYMKILKGRQTSSIEFESQIKRFTSGTSWDWKIAKGAYRCWRYFVSWFVLCFVPGFTTWKVINAHSWLMYCPLISVKYQRTFKIKGGTLERTLCYCYPTPCFLLWCCWVKRQWLEQQQPFHNHKETLLKNLANSQRGWRKDCSSLGWYV